MLIKTNRFLVLLFAITSIACATMNFPFASSSKTVAPEGNWREGLTRLRWIDYAPTNYNPSQGTEPTRESITEDLRILRNAGFEGIITYGAEGALGSTVPEVAEKLGFRGIIIGVWDPSNGAELDAARNAAKTYGVVRGFCVGNEGLGTRYSLDELSRAIRTLKLETGKPATTTEQVEKYNAPRVMALGDWVFPNAHPYWHEVTGPEKAVAWTQHEYESLIHRSKGKLVVLKEVGLPTADDSRVNEANQMKYYDLLAQTNVKFVYFEAFDGPWKTWQKTEKYWGLFRANRAPKEFASHLLHIATATHAGHHS